MPLKDPDARRAYLREWKVKNAAQHRWLNKLADAAIHANARAAKYGAEGKLTAQDIRECFADTECFYCGKPTDLPTVECGQTDSRHAAHGLCNRCWFRKRKAAAS